MVRNSRLKRFRRGDQLTAEALNRIVDMIPTISGPNIVQVGNDYRIKPQPVVGGGSGDITVVKVKKTGGSAGGVGSTVSFTYSIYDKTADVATADPLATALAPIDIRTRITNVEYTAPSDGSYGLATVLDGEWALICAFQERPNSAEACYT